jgi:hypothetical protein
MTNRESGNACGLFQGTELAFTIEDLGEFKLFLCWHEMRE